MAPIKANQRRSISRYTKNLKTKLTDSMLQNEILKKKIENQTHIKQPPHHPNPPTTKITTTKKGISLENFKKHQQKYKNLQELNKIYYTSFHSLNHVISKYQELLSNILDAHPEIFEYDESSQELYQDLQDFEEHRAKFMNELENSEGAYSEVGSSRGSMVTRSRSESGSSRANADLSKILLDLQPKLARFTPTSEVIEINDESSLVGLPSSQEDEEETRPEFSQNEDSETEKTNSEFHQKPTSSSPFRNTRSRKRVLAYPESSSSPIKLAAKRGKRVINSLPATPEPVAESRNISRNSVKAEATSSQVSSSANFLDSISVCSEMTDLASLIDEEDKNSEIILGKTKFVPRLAPVYLLEKIENLNPFTQSSIPA